MTTTTDPLDEALYGLAATFVNGSLVHGILYHPCDVCGGDWRVSAEPEGLLFGHYVGPDNVDEPDRYVVEADPSNAEAAADQIARCPTVHDDVETCERGTIGCVADHAEPLSYCETA